MIGATQLKKEVCFVYQNQPYRVVDYKHTHLGRGGADIRVKARNLLSGAVLSFNFGSNDRFEEAIIVKKKMQFLYQEGSLFYFMDPITFEQTEINEKLLGKSVIFLKEGEYFNILFWQDKPLSIELPSFVVVTIKEADPGVKGNSATNIYKNALTDLGFRIRVPLFIKAGDKIKVDTRTAEYLEKA